MRRCTILAAAAVTIIVIAGRLSAQSSVIEYQLCLQSSDDEAVRNIGTHILACSKVIADASLPAQMRSQALTRRGRFYLMNGEAAPAWMDFDEAIKLDAKNAQAYEERAHKHASDFKSSIDDWTMAIKLGRKRTAIYADRGIAHSQIGSHDLAIEDLTEAIRLGPIENHVNIFTGDRYDLPGLHAARGNAYYLKGDYDRAIVDYDRAMDLDSASSKFIYSRRALAFEKKGDKQKAIADFRKSLSFFPKDNTTKEASSDQEIILDTNG